jgi:hypothetical protein
MSVKDNLLTDESMYDYTKAVPRTILEHPDWASHPCVMDLSVFVVECCCDRFTSADLQGR